MYKISILAFGLLLAGCASAPHREGLSTQFAPQRFSQPLPLDQSSYRIGPADLLKVTVFQVEDLSFDEIRVDASGTLNMPLIGNVQAAGLTPTELSSELEQRLGARYLRNPSVSVTVAEAASQKVTIDGAVAKPGVYEMRGRTTLMQAIAMAEGPTRIADLRKVAVFRNVSEGSMVALFDVQAIRAGDAEDPILSGDDVVVVDTSRLGARMQDILQALPALASFVFYASS
ncbi:polysaccharide biosynthesis/export family protein [Brevundimonas sp. NPDC092305]|uniref:polysaccharide biosynthesis/export family protein n=1 Tax=Brevundimonas sp. NPDC092305 TaxID=3363957 RepID=UPI0037F898EB